MVGPPEFYRVSHFSRGRYILLTVSGCTVPYRRLSPSTFDTTKLLDTTKSVRVIQQWKRFFLSYSPVRPKGLEPPTVWV